METKFNTSDFWDFVERRTGGDVKESSILFSAVIGSHALGLASDTSDYDLRCIFSSTKEQLLGVRRMDYFDIKEGTGGLNYGGHFDGSGYSVPKFIQGLYKGEVNTLELLFVPEHAILHFDERLEPLMLLRSTFITGCAANSLNGEARYLFRRAFNFNESEIKNKDRKERIERYGYDVKAASKAYYHFKAAQRVLFEGVFDLVGDDRQFIKSIREGKYSLDAMHQLLRSEDERTHSAIKDRSKHEVPWQAKEKMASDLIVELTCLTWRDK